MPPTSPTTSPRRDPLGGTTWIAIGSAVNGVAAFGFQVVGTRALGPAAYAPIGVLWTLQYLWIAVAVTAVEAYVTRMTTVSGAGSAELTRFLRLFARWLLATGAATAVVAWVLRDVLFDGIAALAIALGLVVVGYGWYAVVRGRTAGVEIYRTYGLATAAESVLRMAAAVGVLAVSATTGALAWVFPIGPLVVVAWAGRRTRGVRASDRATADEPGTARDDGPVDATSDVDGATDGPGGAAGTLGATPDADGATKRRGRRFLAATSTANAAVQFLLAGGPLVLIPLGADAIAISIFFTTITAARVPMTFALNGGLSRLLPPLTRLSQADDTAGLRRTSVWLVAGIVGATGVAAAGAALLGPQVIAWLFGEDFRPGRAFVVLIVVGTVLAVGGLLLDQVYIATRREHRLPAVWVAAVVLAGLLVLVLPGTPTLRVATAFTVATALAVTALTVPLLRHPARP